MEEQCWLFDLYVVGESPRSQVAIENLNRICGALLGDGYAINIIDLGMKKELWREHQILAVPTVIRRQPLPEFRVVGDLSVGDQVVKGLGLPRQIDLATLEGANGG